MKKYFFGVLFLCFSAAYAAPGCKIPPVTGKTYHQARAVLIEAGFKPVTIPTENSAAVASWRGLGYVEAVDCSGTGSAGCLFAWKTGQGIKAIITTSGEDSPPAYFAKVSRVTCE